MEVRTGRPFTGPTGQALDAELAQVALPRAHLAVLNATACIPPPGSKTPGALAKATKACKPLFDWQLSQTQPDTPALALGAAAGLALSGKRRAIQGGKNVARGFLREHQTRPWLLTWHPTYALFKDKWHLGEFRADLSRFARLIRGELEPAPVHLPATERNLRSIVEEVRDLKTALASDIETGPGRGMPDYTGKDPIRASLRCVGFGSPTRGLVFMAGENSPLVRRTLADPALTKVFHNGWHFDGPVLRRHVFPVVNQTDTREKRFVLAPESRLSLGYITSLYADFPPWKEMEGEGEDATGKGHAKWATKDLDGLRKYCAFDCVATARVNTAMDRELEEHE